MIIFILSFPTSSQNFFVEGRGVKWQKVFKSELSLEEIASAVQREKLFISKTQADSVFIGVLAGVSANVGGAGYSVAMVPVYVSSFYFNASFTIEMRPGRYRVTVEGFGLTNKENEYQHENFNFYATKNGMLKKSFTKKAAAVYDFTLSELFDFKRLPGGSDW